MQRQLQPELMDDPALAPGLHRSALAGLRRINAVSGTAGYLWRAIKQVAASRGVTHLRVLDVACGGGDLALSLASRSGDKGLRVTVDGCDISPVAVETANNTAVRRSQQNAHFFVHDALETPLPDGYEIVLCTLFLHHLNDQQALTLLGRMRDAAAKAVFVDDLVRSRLGYGLAWFGCRLLSRSPIVHYDGPVSVLGAYTPAEVAELARQAGLGTAGFTTHWPQRFLLKWQPT